MASGDRKRREDPDKSGANGPAPETLSPPSPDDGRVPEPRPDDEVDEWGYESFPASDPPQH
jgi:hypothetical protein